MWRTVPVARLLLPFLAGVLCAYSLPVPAMTDRWLVPTLICFWICLLPGWHSRRTPAYRSLFGAGLWCWIFLAGATTYVQVSSPGTVRFPLAEQEKGYFLVQVRDVEQRPDKSDRLTVALLANGPGRDSLYRNRQQLLLYTRNSTDILPADTLLVRGRIRRVPPPRNPGAFDYQFYLFTRRIRYQVFVQELLPLPVGRPSVSVSRTIYQWRQRLSKRLVQDTHSPAVAAVSLALVLGQKDQLDDKMRETYARAGAMHVLAVSGLHVGIVAVFVQGLLRGILPAGRFRRRISILGGIVAVWLFALLTGAAPSVLRAAIMFSLFMVGQLYRTRAGVWNSILAAAFLMLCVNPLFIFQLSFQLSFSAVAGILFFYPLFYRMLYPPGRFFTYIWQLLCVGLAAQLATAPLTVYHFGQFPLLFWLSGWIVIPLATLILGSGLLKIALLPVPVLGDLAVRMVNGSIMLMNQAMQRIAEQPMAVVDQLSMPPAVLMIIYASLLVGMVSRRFLPAWRAWSGWPLFCVLCALSHYQWSIGQQRVVVVYLADEKMLVDVVQGREVLALYPAEVSAASRRFAVSGFRQKKSLAEVRELTVDHTPFIAIDAGALQVGWQRAPGVWPDTVLSQLDILLVEAGPPPPVGTGGLTASTDVFLGPGLSPKERARWLQQRPGQCQLLNAGRCFFLPENP